MHPQYADDTKPGGGVDRPEDSGVSTNWRNKPTGILWSPAAGNVSSVAVAEQLCAPVETGASQLGNSLAGKDMEVPVDTKLSWRERQLTASWAAPKNITSGSRNMIILLYSTKESQTGGSEFIAIFVQKLRQKGFLILRRESLGALFDMYKL